METVILLLPVLVIFCSGFGAFLGVRLAKPASGCGCGGKQARAPENPALRIQRLEEVLAKLKEARDV